MSKKVLVTGGAGCIGSHLVQQLCKIGQEVTIFDNLMRGKESYKNLEEIFETCKPEFVCGDIVNFNSLSEVFERDFDIVYHLAALPSHRLALENPRDYALVDMLGTVNVLECARLSRSKPTIVFGSSNKVYGKQLIPFKENMVPLPQGPYGQAKASSEEWCKQYSEYYGLNTPILRYHHIIGPRTQPDREISIFTERVINNLNPIVHGINNIKNGKFISCSADYTDVRDAVEATILASDINGFDVFNIATGKLTKVEDIARQVISLLGKEHEISIEHKQMLSHESLTHLSNVSKAKKILDFEAKYSVEDAVKTYVEWRLKRGERKQAVYR